MIKPVLKPNKGRSRFYFLSFLIFIGLLASRRWQQFVFPQVWDEDGVKVIPSFIRLGWRTFLVPVNGYLITVPKIISAVSLEISFSHYPIISTVFSWLFIAFVGLAITYAPTKLKGRFLCAVAVFVIPTNPEVFGLPLYTFWWVSILLFLCVLWDENKPALGWRLLFLILGGLSSPVIVLILPILYLRIFLYRSLRSEKIVALIATLIGIIQFRFIAEDSMSQKVHATKSISTYHDYLPDFLAKFSNCDFVSKFFGNFVMGNLSNNYDGLYFAGLGLLGLVLVWLFQNRNYLQTWILFYLLIGSIGLTTARTDLALINPGLDGPRYFFLTFIILFWILISLFLSANSKWFQGLIVTILIIGIVNAKPVWSRTHDNLHWINHVSSGRFFINYNIPIMVYGSRTAIWPLSLPEEVYKSLLEQDTLSSRKEMDKYPTYPYNVLGFKSRNKKMTRISPA